MSSLFCRCSTWFQQHREASMSSMTFSGSIMHRCFLVAKPKWCPTSGIGNCSMFAVQLGNVILFKMNMGFAIMMIQCIWVGGLVCFQLQWEAYHYVLFENVKGNFYAMQKRNDICSWFISILFVIVLKCVMHGSHLVFLVREIVGCSFNPEGSKGQRQDSVWKWVMSTVL
jgi:hypothetical protein